MQCPDVNELSAKPRRIDRWGALECLLFLTFVGCCTLYAACSFFRSRDLQLGWADAARSALDPNSLVRRLPRVWWSAPLDDTFIHFDFARSFARFRPFEWTIGGGYSSGATSWLYPILLSVGVLLAQDGQALGTVADVLACVSVFAFFWGCRGLFGEMPKWSSYLLPPLVLTSGVLGWSLWSGMELALFFAVWALVAHYYAQYQQAPTACQAARARRGMALASVLLVMTRPEALGCSIIFALFSVYGGRDQRAQRWRTFGQLLAPAVSFTLFRALLNLVLTGSLADAGALVKLHTLRPFLEPREVALKWLDNIGFQFTRITTYHTTDDAVWGWQFWLLLGMACLPRRSRRTVALLTCQALAWLLLVAQNDYVRYQNDRYTMPVVMFLLVAIALGLAAALMDAHQSLGRPVFVGRLIGAVFGTLLTGSFVAHQFPRISQQLWLFGRASRNIAEQQIRVGQLFRAGQFGPTHRILVGDAGAIAYFSELRGVDAIGLGGTEGLPFSKAVNLGVGATVELIERMAPEDRPDKLAIYPSWWDLLPVWFGRKIEEVRIKGNVICGAADKVIYEADWRGLENVSLPPSLATDYRLLDELDFADVVSESEHGYHITAKHSGYVVMRILPHPNDPQQELFDAGRLVFADSKARFYLRGFRRGRPAKLTFRAAPKEHMAFRIRADGQEIGKIELDGGSGWQEPSIDLEAQRLRETMAFEIIAESSEHILYHVWATGK